MLTQQDPRVHSCAGGRAEVTVLLSVGLLSDLSTHEQWVLMTKEHKAPLPSSDAAVIPVGQRPGQSCPTLLNLPIQSVTLPAPSHPSHLHSTHAHPVRVSAWHSGCSQAKACPAQQKQQCRA